MRTVFTSLLALYVTSAVVAFPRYGSLAGLSERQLAEIIPTLDAKLPPQPPGPQGFTGAKLVDDAAHPWRPLRRGDIRGPCPGLNTLASHGYLPRDGVVTPAQLIVAVQEGLNFDHQTARVATYLAHLGDGNLVTDLISIGEKTTRTGPDPPRPAIVGGLNNHGTFEGDGSLTRGDFFDGDNHSFNQTLFDQFIEFSNRYGNGFYNLTVAAELRFRRIQQSIATNPTFSMVGLRHITIYGEATFPVNFFVDGRRTGAQAGQLSIPDATSFFRDMRFPRGFFRSATAGGATGADILFNAHPIQPGRNVGGVNNFVEDQSLGGILEPCRFYTQFVNTTIRGLYPRPTGVLRRNLIINAGFLYDALSPPDCPQVFPWGQL
ncbi:aromatic peroxygenase precursor [Coprinopsis marcescibilis]|uniref:Aromatic peroxygenase n=1 Tax=Coprinopsis marcescibilis TaxID=230819 RepID=A0A5C3KE59_COPMA|nr:aromatic peroxygenase precursor [Coprinopsis marcescibilis]